MAGMAAIPPEYGWVVLTLFASFWVLAWMGINVGRARKKFNVNYPTMYSDKDPLFNCIQRAHQNTQEAIPYYFIFTLLGGLQHPVFTSVCSLIFIAGRIAYAKGYYTGDPEKRLWGSFGYFGLFGMMGTTISFALHLLGFLG